MTPGPLRLALALAGIFVLGCATSIPRAGGMPWEATAGEIAEAERLMGLSLDSWIEQTTRVQRISQRMRIAGRRICGRAIAPVLGVAVIDVDTITAELRPIAIERMGEHGRLHVVEVFGAMAAARAGLNAGDAIVAVGGRPVRRLDGLLRPIGLDVENIEVQVDRDGQLLELDVPVELGCSYITSLFRAYWSSDTVNAELHGSAVLIHLALAREIPDDDRLAVVIGHEIAHGIVRDELGRRRSGPETEERADYLGCYLAALAGYDFTKGMKLFQVLVRDLNRLGRDRGTHPATHERTLALRRTLQEIERKRSAGEPLVPNLL